MAHAPRRVDSLSAWSRRWLCTALLADLAALVFLTHAWVSDPQKLIDIRRALFTRLTTDPELFERPTEELRARGFRTDTLAVREYYRNAIDRETDLMVRLGGDFSSLTALDKVKRIVRLFARDGGGRLPDSTDLLDKLIALPKRAGLCSDHTEVFQALCSVLDIDAREIITTRHNTAMFFSPEHDRWIWVDPEFSLFARDQRGEYLSALGLRRAFLAEQPVDFEFFGDETQILAREQARQHPGYQTAADFSDVCFQFGNNVFEVDLRRIRMRDVPKPVRQFIGLVEGVVPPYYMLLDPHAVVAANLRREQILWSALALALLLLNLIYPVSLVLDRRGRGRRAVTIAAPPSSAALRRSA